MRAIKRTDTQPEREIRSEIHRRGLRYRKDFRIRIGGAFARPDVVFTRRKIAVFVDGCFWHSCPLHGKLPSVNTSYWAPKLARTQARDGVANELLATAGWQVVRVWEHASLSSAADIIEHVFDDRRRVGQGGPDSPTDLITVG